MVRSGRRRRLSAAAFRRRDVRFVARGVRQRPPHGCELVAHHPAPGRERGLDATLGQLVRHEDGHVDRTEAIASRLILNCNATLAHTTARTATGIMARCTGFAGYRHTAVNATTKTQVAARAAPPTASEKVKWPK